MSILLSDKDKETIYLIDFQVNQLSARKASDHVIINTLIDFIPDVKCILNGTCEKQLDLYCKAYPYFHYLLKLLSSECVFKAYVVGRKQHYAGLER